MRAGDVVARLDGVDPFECAAVGLYREIKGGGSAMDLYPQMEEAIRELDLHTAKVKGVVRRCNELQARPAREVPAGF